MIKNLSKNLFLFIILVIFFSINTSAYENFDECGILEKYIKENYIKNSLDEPGVFINEYAGLNFEYKPGSKEEFKRDKNNFLIIDRFATEFEDFDDYVFPLYLTKVKSLSVQNLSDEEIVKIFNNKQSKYIEIEYLENNLKKEK